MIQCKPPVTRWCNNLSLAGKRPVRIKSPITRIQYLREVPGFRSAGHILRPLSTSNLSILALLHLSSQCLDIQLVIYLNLEMFTFYYFV